MDFPDPASPYSTKNFWIFDESPANTDPMPHSSFCLWTWEYSLSMSVSYADGWPSVRSYGNLCDR